MQENRMSIIQRINESDRKNDEQSCLKKTAAMNDQIRVEPKTNPFIFTLDIFKNKKQFFENVQHTNKKQTAKFSLYLA